MSARLPKLMTMSGELIPPQVPRVFKHQTGFSIFKVSCECLLLALLIIVIYFVFFRKSEGFQSAPVMEQELVDPGHNNVCSSDCCCTNQWPTPYDEEGMGASIEEYEKTNLQCRGCNGVGCLCKKKGSTALPSCSASAKP